MSEDYPCFKHTRLTMDCRKEGDNIVLTVNPADAEICECTLAKSAFDLHSYILDLTKKLEEIINKPEYRNEIKIDPNTYQEDLNKIARLNIMDSIFLGTSKRYDPENNACLNVIKKVLEKPSRISISTRGVFLPWALFYEGDVKKIGKGESANPKYFWGFKHLIEQKIVNSSGIIGHGNDFAASRTEYLLSCFLNRDLDEQCIVEHDGLIGGIKNPFRAIIGTKKQDVIDAFAGDEERDYCFIYFFCHAKTGVAFESRMEDSCILLTDQNPLTPDDLQVEAISKNFVAEPVVFVNACESAAMSPLFYRGFTPYFFLKGSKYIVGTLSSVPAKFASSFGIKFLRKYLQGEKAGNILFELSNEFLLQYNNIVGLYYVSYGPSTHHLVGTKYK